MTILEQLTTKIDEVISNYEAMHLKNEALTLEVITLKSKAEEKEESLEMLKMELEEKESELQKMLDKLTALTSSTNETH